MRALFKTRDGYYELILDAHLCVRPNETRMAASLYRLAADLPLFPERALPS